MKKENKKISTKADTNLISNIQSLTSNNHKGITLIALIITIIVMLILAGVSITIALKGGLFDTTKRAAKEAEAEKNAEQELANGRVKIDGVWYDSIEDYVGGKQSDNQTEPEKPVEPEKPDEPVTPPEEPVVKPEVGDYVKYEPDIISTSYSLLGKYSGWTSDQTIAQEKLDWQILKIHEDGSIDLIGTPTENVGFRGTLGYNNGVYLMHDICKELYSKKSAGIEARSVSLEDFEDEDNGGIWKSARDAYKTAGNIQYNTKKTYTTNTNYPNLYARENSSGINTTVVKTDGIKSTDKGYTTPTEETSSKASSRLTVTQTYYSIAINEENYGKSAKVLLESGYAYWVASRVTQFDTHLERAIFGLGLADTLFEGTGLYFSVDLESGGSFYLRPIVTLQSSAELKLSTEGVDGEPNTFNITKY